MSNALDQSLLEAVLDSWDRNNAILVNLLRAVPEDGLAVRAMEGSPPVAELFTHIHSVRLVFIFEDAPQFARELPKEEWAALRDPDRIAQMLNESAKAVRDAVKSWEIGRLHPGFLLLCQLSIHLSCADDISTLNMLGHSLPEGKRHGDWIGPVVGLNEYIRV
jgi:hypothetical protein